MEQNNSTGISESKQKVYSKQNQWFPMQMLGCSQSEPVITIPNAAICHGTGGLK